MDHNSWEGIVAMGEGRAGEKWHQGVEAQLDVDMGRCLQWDQRGSLNGKELPAGAMVPG